MRHRLAHHLAVLAALQAMLAPTSGRATPRGDQQDDLAERPQRRSVDRHPEEAFAAPRETGGAGGVGATDAPGRSTARELLDNRAEVPGVFLPRRSAAGALPVVRGLRGNRVLVLLDGVRLNHAISRPDDDTLLATVDPMQIAGVEVLYGPGSVAFGSGALGGVIDLRSRRDSFDPRRAWDLGARSSLAWDSGGHGLVGHASASGHLRMLGLAAAGSLRRQGDVGSGRGGDPQPLSGFWGGSAHADATISFGDSGTIRLGYSTVAVLDAPLPAASAGRRDFSLLAEQWRDLLTLGTTVNLGHRVLDRIEATVALQSHRFDRQRALIDDDRVEREEDRVLALGAAVTARTRLPYNRLSLGLDLSADDVASSAEQESISSRTVSQLDRGRYHDGSRLLRFGAFALDRLTLGDKLAIDLGGRISGWSAFVPIAADEELQKTDWTASGSAHARYLVGDGLNLVGGVAQGFRAPNIDDYSARGCGIDRYDVPNEDLGAERSLTVEAGVKLDLFGLLRGSVFYYYSHLDNLIIARPATIDTGEGPVSTFTCGANVDGTPRVVPILRRENASGAIHGLQGRLQLDVGRWALFGWLSWSRGKVTVRQPAGGSFDEPLDGVPPLNGIAGLRYTAKSTRWFAQLAVRWAARQQRLGAVDRADPTICTSPTSGTCAGTPGYAALDLRGGAQLHDALRLTLAVNNLTDERYRLHGAALDAVGLSALIGLEVSVR